MDKVIVIRHSNEPEHSHYDEYKAKYGMHFNQKLLDYALKYIENNNMQKHSWTVKQIEEALKQSDAFIPTTSNIYDIAYTANMAYADFFPHILDEQKCIDFAMAVANDIDGYEGIQLSRWIADQMGKNMEINWEEFI